MSTTKNSTARTKKLWAVAGVGVLAAAIAGGGALSTLTTSIADNSFTAKVPERTDEPLEGALLEITGAPIDKEFNTATVNDMALGDWELTNHGATPVDFDGAFELHQGIDQALAEALKVEYGVTTSAGAISWEDAGTLAETSTLYEVLGTRSIDGDTTIPVRVRVKLENPQVLVDAGVTAEPLQVTGDFTVTYMDPLGRP